MISEVSEKFVDADGCDWSCLRSVIGGGRFRSYFEPNSRVSLVGYHSLILSLGTTHHQAQSGKRMVQDASTFPVYSPSPSEGPAVPVLVSSGKGPCIIACGIYG